MPKTFTIQMDEEAFRIVGPDGEEGEAVAYGDLAVLTIGSAIYYCALDDPDADTAQVLRVDSVSKMPTEVEEVEFEEAEEEDNETAGPVLVEAETEDPA